MAPSLAWKAFDEFPEASKTERSELFVDPISTPDRPTRSKEDVPAAPVLSEDNVEEERPSKRQDSSASPTKHATPVEDSSDSPTKNPIVLGQVRKNRSPYKGGSETETSSPDQKTPRTFRGPADLMEQFDNADRCKNVPLLIVCFTCAQLQNLNLRIIIFK